MVYCRGILSSKEQIERRRGLKGFSVLKRGGAFGSTSHLGHTFTVVWCVILGDPARGLRLLANGPGGLDLASNCLEEKGG